ncbi:hypothetical protein HJG60_009509 [Phyllostomus discolor]|uniref:Uncharacterized protein n=1 Tax=Phyllostomus discolor TaxID=89673 RepID=A0A834DDL4_9CHIR|nr:hypothetical protein HJG60_009509 [Phyllostomus discolor]
MQIQAHLNLQATYRPRKARTLWPDGLHGMRSSWWEGLGRPGARCWKAAKQGTQRAKGGAEGQAREATLLGKVDWGEIWLKKKQKTKHLGPLGLDGGGAMHWKESVEEGREPFQNNTIFIPHLRLRREKFPVCENKTGLQSGAAVTPQTPGLGLFPAGHSSHTVTQTCPGDLAHRPRHEHVGPRTPAPFPAAVPTSDHSTPEGMTRVN